MLVSLLNDNNNIANITSSSPSYRFLLIFERHPELFQFRWDRRARQLQSLDDVASVASLVFGDESVGKALAEERPWWPPVKTMDAKHTVNNSNSVQPCCLPGPCVRPCGRSPRSGSGSCS